MLRELDNNECDPNVYGARFIYIASACIVMLSFASIVTKKN